VVERCDVGRLPFFIATIFSKTSIYFMVLSWKIVRFTLKETFSISYGNYSHRDALVITLSQNNVSGYGECTSIDYYQINLQDFENKLLAIQSKIEKYPITHPTDFYNFISQLGLHSFLKSALDCAFWDLFGKLQNKTFIELNNLNTNELPESSITISVAPIAIQIEKIKNSSWSKFKVKLNHFDEFDIRKLADLNKNSALDANGSFTKEQCSWLENQEFANRFSYIEQPMKTGVANYSVLNADLNANWMADEEVQETTNLHLLQTHYKTINIKLVKCGGITPALALISHSKELGFKTMIGCMTESTIGISAGAVLTPLVDFVDLDGANLIANDVAKGSSVINGKILLSENPGLGIQIL
jgi:L-Ala-D/L-Glu epimerase